MGYVKKEDIFNKRIPSSKKRLSQEKAAK